jgi:hypothetical protein
MRLLITNHTLARRTGTELVVYEMAKALRSRGHEVAAYSSRLGEVAEMLRASSIPVVENPLDCPFQPDLIHGQHHLDTMTALLAYPGTPAVYHCHGGGPWQETPPRHPRILRYLAMCRHLASTLAIELHLPRERVHALPNWVDLSRFTMVRHLHRPAQTALLFGTALGTEFHQERLASAFTSRGITLETSQAWTDEERRWPELALARYDIVLATGRSALEALASGCSVLVTNEKSCIGWVRTSNFEALRCQNLSPKNADPGYSAATLGGHLDAYDPEDAAAVTALTRQSCHLQGAIDALEAIHRAALDEWNSATPAHPTDEQERTAFYRYFRNLAPVVTATDAVARDNLALTERADALKAETKDLQAQIRGLNRSLAKRSGKRSRSSWWLSRLNALLPRAAAAAAAKPAPRLSQTEGKGN